MDFFLNKLLAPMIMFGISTLYTLYVQRRGEKERDKLKKQEEILKKNIESMRENVEEFSLDAINISKFSEAIHDELFRHRKERESRQINPIDFKPISFDSVNQKAKSPYTIDAPFKKNFQNAIEQINNENDRMLEWANNLIENSNKFLNATDEEKKELRREAREAREAREKE